MSRDPRPGNFILRKEGELRSNHALIFKGTLHQKAIREGQGPSRGIIHKCQPHERKFEERSQDEISRAMRPQSSMGLGEKFFKLKNADKTTFFYPVEVKAIPAQQKRETICGWFRSFDAHAQQKDLSSDELETLRRSRNQTVVVTANGEVQTHEETQVLCSRWPLRDSEITRRYACSSIGG